MDGERKYRQQGYQDSGRGEYPDNEGRRDDRPRPQGPRPPIDVTGPRLPRLVQAVAASRCFNCAATLPLDMDFQGNCPKCGAALHCCKQCKYFDSSTRFQCLKPIPVRIAGKDQANECEFFKSRVTVARDAPPPAANGDGYAGSTPPTAAPRSAGDASAAFDSLFKKTE